MSKRRAYITSWKLQTDNSITLTIGNGRKELRTFGEKRPITDSSLRRLEDTINNSDKFRLSVGLLNVATFVHIYRR